MVKRFMSKFFIFLFSLIMINISSAMELSTEEINKTNQILEESEKKALQLYTAVIHNAVKDTEAVLHNLQQSNCVIDLDENQKRNILHYAAAPWAYKASSRKTGKGTSANGMIFCDYDSWEKPFKEEMGFLYDELDSGKDYSYTDKVSEDFWGDGGLAIGLVPGIGNTSVDDFNNAKRFFATNKKIGKLLLNSNKFDITAQDACGFTALHAAVLGSNLGMVELLAQYKNILDKPDHKGRTPLHLAAYIGCENIVKILIEAGATINAQDNEKQSPLWYAVTSDCTRFKKNNRKKIIQHFCEQNNLDLQNEKLIQVLHQQQYNEWKKLIDEEYNRPLPVKIGLSIQAKNKEQAIKLLNADKDEKTKQDIKNYRTLHYDENLLHLAATYGLPEIAQVLIETYAIDLNETNQNGNTPLHLAIQSYDQQCTQLAIVGKNDKIENIKKDLLVVIEYFVEKGSCVNGKNVFSRTPLEMCYKNNRKEIKNIFLKYHEESDLKPRNTFSFKEFFKASHFKKIALFGALAAVCYGAYDYFFKAASGCNAFYTNLIQKFSNYRLSK